MGFVREEVSTDQLTSADTCLTFVRLCQSASNNEFCPHFLIQCFCLCRLRFFFSYSRVKLVFPCTDYSYKVFSLHEQLWHAHISCSTQRNFRGMSYSFHSKVMSCACVNPDAGLGLQVFQCEHQLFPGMHRQCLADSGWAEAYCRFHILTLGRGRFRSPTSRI